MASRSTPLLAAAVAAGATLVIGVLLNAAGPPARAAVIGTIILDPTTRPVGFVPMAQSATTTAGCPTGFTSSARMFVRPVGGTATSGNFLSSTRNGTDTDLSAPFTLQVNRSLQTGLGGTVPAGDYEVFVECRNASVVASPDVISVIVTVTGANWAVRDAPTLSPSPTPTSASPSPSSPSPSPSSASPSPSRSPSQSPSPTPSQSPSPTPSESPSEDPSESPSEDPSGSPSPSETGSIEEESPGNGGGGLALTGTSIPIIAGSGLLMVAGGVWAVLLTIRRRTALASAGEEGDGSETV